MSTRKIGEIEEKKECRHPEHNPPTMMVYEPGVWEHICPGCGKRQVFRIEREPSL